MPRGRACFCGGVLQIGYMHCRRNWLYCLPERQGLIQFDYCVTLGGKMRKLAIAAAALAFTSSAYAADMPLKAPAAPLVVPYNWSGLYGDLDVGWGRSEFNWQYVNAPGFGQFGLSTSNAVLGGHVGLQYQWNFLVLGVEGGLLQNIGSSYASAGSAGPAVCTTPPLNQSCQVHVSGAVKTIGGKLGFAWNDWLLYGVGGAAWGEVQTQLVNNVNGSLFDSGTQNRNGWYAGGGFDYVVLKGGVMDLILGVEYQHVDLKSQLIAVSFDNFNPAGVNARTISAKEDMVLGKLTFKLNPWR